MKTLSIDIETYSDIPLQKTGVYRYCESPNFEILLFGYSIDSGPVQVVDLAWWGAYPQGGAGRAGGRFRHQVGLQCCLRAGVPFPVSRLSHR